MTEILLWAGYFAVFAFLVHKGRSKDAVLSGSVGFGVQAFAYVATYISAVALVGFGGLAHAYGLQCCSWPRATSGSGRGPSAAGVANGKWQNASTRAPGAAARPGTAQLGKGGRLCFRLVRHIRFGGHRGGILLAGSVPSGRSSGWWRFVGLTVFIGGLRGVLYTEAMQGVVMLVGMLMLVGAIFSKVGGPWEGMQALAALPPSDLANNGFVSLSGGERGLFILSLVVVTSIAVWAQPQMMQRHFAIADPRQLKKTTPLAMFILTVLVGGAYFAAALSRLILPEVASPDQVMPKLVQMLLPEFALHIFVLAIVSASLSTATGIYHIAVSALSEDLRGRPSNRLVVHRHRHLRARQRRLRPDQGAARRPALHHQLEHRRRNGAGALRRPRALRTPQRRGSMGQRRVRVLLLPRLVPDRLRAHLHLGAAARFRSRGHPALLHRLPLLVDRLDRGFRPVRIPGFGTEPDIPLAAWKVRRQPRRLRTPHRSAGGGTRST
ncbi:MAG: sodium:solute symporter family transporter [Bilophila wadsworthia]